MRLSRILGLEILGWLSWSEINGLKSSLLLSLSREAKRSVSSVLLSVWLFQFQNFPYLSLYFVDNLLKFNNFCFYHVCPSSLITRVLTLCCRLTSMCKGKL